MIKAIDIPGVLIEGGFMSGARDARMIASGDYRQRIAGSILQAVKAYTRSVSGKMDAAPPTLIVKGDDPTSRPTLAGDDAPGSEPEVVTPPPNPRPTPGKSVNRTPESKQGEKAKNDDDVAARPEPAGAPTPSVDKPKVDKWW